MSGVPFLDAAEVRRRLAPLAAVDALERALRDGLDPDADPPRAVVALGGDGGADDRSMLVMPSAAAPSPVVKVVTVGGDPRIQGLCLAFDAKTLAPAALLDGAAVTLLRTAAVSALAVRHLVRQDARRLVVLGRGPQAQAHAEAIQAVRPQIDRVDLLGRDDPRRDELVAAADVVACCTTARAPLFDGALVAAHATVVAIGSHEPDAREVDAELVHRSTVVVESPATALREAGDLVLAGDLAADDLLPLAALVRGEAHADPRRPRLFKSTGMALEDAVVVDALLGG